MEYLHSRSAISIENMTDENDELSVTPRTNEETSTSSKTQIDSITDDNISLSTTIIRTNDERTSSMNQPSSQDNLDRTSPGPGLAKPISFGTKRIDAALEKNLETIATQVRRTTTKPSQLTQNDLQLFDSTSNGHHSREMTPDSINTDSANEESIQNGQYYSRSIIPPSTIDPYGQALWPPAVYPFAPQHPGLYLPYPPPTANGLPPFYPSLIEPQTLSAYYQQQQAAAARFLQEHASLSDNFSSILTTPTKDPTKKNKSSINLQTINGSLTGLSPDLLSDGDGGGTNDADSIISIDSIKSNTAISMPVLEDGLSDSENISDDEHSPPAPRVAKKPINRHQSTQIDLNHSPIIPSHKQQHAKVESQSPSFYMRPQAPLPSTARMDQQKPPSEDSSTIATDKKLRKKGLFRMFIFHFCGDRFIPHRIDVN
jgi:hypothetical protein